MSFLFPFTFYLTCIVYGSATIQSGFYTKALCHAVTTEKIISLSFDDGPNIEFTPAILKILSEHKVTATFFVIGKNIHGNETLLKQMNTQGHLIGNHTYSHSYFIDFKTAAGFKFELNQTSDIIYNTIGKRPALFRPPYGVTTPNLVAASNALNYKIIGWNIRSLDTTKDSAAIIRKRVENQMKPGSIILFHDTSIKTAEILNQTLNFAKENGFKIVSTEELLKIKAYL